MEYDCGIHVRFLTASEGGRETALNSTEYRVPILFEGQGFEARLYPSAQDLPVNPGGTLTVPVGFLNPDSVSRFLRQGQQLELWEGKVVARGEIAWVGEGGDQ